MKRLSAEIATRGLVSRFCTALLCAALLCLSPNTASLAAATVATADDATTVIDSVPLAAETGVSSGAASATLTADQLDSYSESIADALDEYLETNFPRTHEPGVAVAVVTRQGIAYYKTMGTCESVDDTFFIGSLSKSMCAVAIMQLVEQGRIDLDEPAAAYAPEFLTPPQVTVRMLLNQTSGFGFYQSLNQATVGDTLGEFSYSNANYDLLGRIVEHVSGQSYSDYLAQHVFAPLGMNDSSAQGLRTNDVLGSVGLNDADGVADTADVFDGASTIVSAGALGADGRGSADAGSVAQFDADAAAAGTGETTAANTVTYGDTRSVLGHRNYYGAYIDDGFQHAANDDAWGGPSSGYVSSSIRDMASYLQMYLNGGSNVLSSDSVMQMFMSRVQEPGSDSYYGMGWFSFYWDDDDELVFSHDGDVETNVASMCVFPERGIGVVVLGDGYDSVAGNSLFFQMASGVTDIVTGYDAPDLDADEYTAAHDDVNKRWAKFLGTCALPLVGGVLWALLARAFFGRRARARRGAAGANGEVLGNGSYAGVAAAVGSEAAGLPRDRACLLAAMLTAADVTAFALAVVLVAGVPEYLGVPWRDISTFDPSISFSLIVASMLIAVALIIRALVALWAIHRRHRDTLA
jgi:CubicO group peptidase (beta-lactamase class C family)